MDPERKIINVVGAAIVTNGTVLCAQRGPGKSLAGYWEFPGGKIEPHETARQAFNATPATLSLKRRKDYIPFVFGEESEIQDFYYDVMLPVRRLAMRVGGRRGAAKMAMERRLARSTLAEMSDTCRLPSGEIDYKKLLQK